MVISLSIAMTFSEFKEAWCFKWQLQEMMKNPWCNWCAKHYRFYMLVQAEHTTLEDTVHRGNHFILPRRIHKLRTPTHEDYFGLPTMSSRLHAKVWGRMPMWKTSWRCAIIVNWNH
jgi:hypothetical protein